MVVFEKPFITIQELSKFFATNTGSAMKNTFSKFSAYS